MPVGPIAAMYCASWPAPDRIAAIARAGGSRRPLDRVDDARVERRGGHAPVVLQLVAHALALARLAHDPARASARASSSAASLRVAHVDRERHPARDRVGDVRRHRRDCRPSSPARRRSRARSRGRRRSPRRRPPARRGGCASASGRHGPARRGSSDATSAIATMPSTTPTESPSSSRNGPCSMCSSR